MSSKTIRMPWRSDSSRSAEMSSIFLARTSEATVWMNEVLFTWYGISLTMIESRPLRSSKRTLPRTRMLPRPVSSAARMPSRDITPPVGKSGPLTCFMSPSTVMSRSWIIAIRPSTISVRLCGARLVAMPTAMPAAPFTSRLGMADGRTSGSMVVSSKLALVGTVSLSRSASSASAEGIRRASV